MKEKESAPHNLPASLTDGWKRDILESALDAVVGMDDQGMIIDWNRQAETIFGWSKAEAIGRPLSMIVPSKYQDAHNQGLRRFLETRHGPILNRRIDIEAVRRDGQVFPVELTVIPFVLEGRDFFYSFIRDTSERKRAEDRFRALFEQAPFSIQLLSVDGRTLAVNSAWQQMMQVPDEAIRDYVLKQYNLLEDPQLVAKGLMPLIRKAFQGEGVKLPAILYDPAEIGQPGRQRWIEAYIYPIKDELGRVREVVLVHEDVTDRNETERALRESRDQLRRANQEAERLVEMRTQELRHQLAERVKSEELLRRSEERLRLLFEGVKDYTICMLDPEGNVAAWNEGAKRIKGYDAAEILGKHFSIFYPAESLGKPALELREATRLGSYEDEGWRVRKDGSRFWANTIITAIHGKDGTLLGFSKVTRDLTERRRAEEEIRQARDTLEIRVEERTAELKQALEARDEFLSIASHELKTPVTSLKLQIQMHQRKINKKDPAAFDPVAIERLVRTADRQIDRLSKLIEDMLDISRIVHGKLRIDLEEVDLGKLVADVLNRLLPQMEAAGCKSSIQVESGIVGMWDRYRIEQVVINIFTNAMKYGAGKPVEISVRSVSGKARLAVKDQGIGIEKANLERIFQRFERAVTANEISGLGLGLYISKQIVEAHGGSIHAESEIGRGATFIVELPLVGALKA